MGEAPEKIGALAYERWETKKICDWEFKSSIPVPPALVEKLGLPTATVTLKYAGHWHADDKKKVSLFVATSNWFEDISAESIDALRIEVAKTFCDRVIADSVVVWSDWLEVKIEGNTTHDWFSEGGHRVRKGGELSSSLSITCKRLKRAKFPDGSDKVLDGESLNPFPKAKKAGTKRETIYSRGYYQDDDAQYAYIPATPENEAALKELMRKMDDLNGVLQAVLAQGELAKTIKALTGGQLRLDDRKG